MPLKKDGTGTRKVEMEIVVPGTPEQVWQALATGPGNTAWFTRTTIDERVGGEIRFDFGPMGNSTGEVTAWDPPQRFGYVERNWSEGAPPVATEITIASRKGGTCVIRMVHSLFASTDDWDDQLEGFEKGWPAFFDVLRVHLMHFAGRPAASFTVMASGKGENRAIWTRTAGALGLAGVDAGETRALPSSPESWAGIVERVAQSPHERLVVLRLTAPAPGVLLFTSTDTGGALMVSASFYLHGDDAVARAASSETRWREWLAAQCAAS